MKPPVPNPIRGLVLAFLPALMVTLLLATGLRARPDGTSIPEDQGVLSGTPCFVTFCHDDIGSTLNQRGSLTLEGLPAAFVPGQTYFLTARIEGGDVYGVQIAALFSDDTQAGVLTSDTAGIVSHAVNGVSILSHSPSPLNSGTVAFRWSAPAEPKEDSITFKLASNSANGNFSPTGDDINTLEVVVPRQAIELTENLFFAQFADGLGLSSQVTLVNRSGTQMVNGEIEQFVFDADGAAATIDLNGDESQKQSFLIPAGGSAVFASDGLGDLRAGGVVVRSDQPLSGVVLFAGSGLGAAGVGSSRALSSFLAPMEMDTANQVRTGIAVMDPEGATKTLQVELRDPGGNLVATGTFGPESGSQPLGANGQIARFLDEPEFNLQGSPDLSNFRGVLKITASSGQVAATVIRQSPGEFATLPVTEPQ